ncbi:MAG: putative porin [Bacteroidales bacterium]
MIMIFPSSIHKKSTALVTFLIYSLILLLFIFHCSLSQAQSTLTDSTKISYSFFQADSIAAAGEIIPDTLPGNIHFYDPVTYNYQAYAVQGNIGRAVRNLIPSFQLYPGFDAGFNTFKPYCFNPDDIALFRHYFPFTNIHYVMGGKKEQLFDITHSQNLGSRFIASARLRIINSPGSYQHQKSDISSLIFTGQYHSKNQKYEANISFCQNILKIQENGGITSDSTFENNQEPDRRVIPVNLLSAQNRIRESSVVAGQRYQFVSDSLLKRNKWLAYMPLSLMHTTRYTEYSRVYDEPDNTNDFYPFPPLDTSITQDELLYHQLNNKLLLVNPGYKYLKYAAGFVHQDIFIRDERNEARYGQLASYFELLLKLPYNIDLNAKMMRWFGGYNEGDNFSGADLNKIFYRSGKPLARLSLWGRTSETMPEWTQMHYHSNLINWENKFNTQLSNSAGVKFFFKNLELGYQTHSIENYIYNEKATSIPQQLTTDLNITQFYVQLKVRLWKIMLDNRYDYQKVDKIQYLHLPQYITRHSVYFDFNLFKGALILQPGFSVYWQSMYYADAYMPLTSAYYLQNSTLVNDQFYADFFINMKVSRARIFLKYQHLNSNFGTYDYYQVPHYPVQDAAIRFGVYWLLRDLPDRDKKFTLEEK